MDGEKLSDELNYMLLCWESNYTNKINQRRDSLYRKLEDTYFQVESKAIEEDTISPIINKYIVEIEDEIEKKNEIKRKEKLELERLKKLEEDEKEKKIQEEIKQREEKEREEKEREKKEREKKEREEKKREEKEREEKKREEKEREEKEREGLKGIQDKKGVSFGTDFEKQNVVPLVDDCKKDNKDNGNEVSRLLEYSRSVETVEKFENSNEFKEIVSSTDATIKSTRINTKKTIQLSINQISSTNQQIILSSQRIKNMLSDMRFSQSGVASSFYNYSLYLAATLFVDQCSSQISAHPESVWCYSYSCMQILEDNKDFIYFLEGIMFKEFKFLYTSDLDDISIKHDKSKNIDDSFLKRLGSVVRFYLSINILRGSFGKIWIWLVKLLNCDKPHKLFPIVMISVVEIISYFFKNVFKIQYIKIIDYILNHKLPKIYESLCDDSIPIKAHCKKLEGLLNNVKSIDSCKDNSFNSPPSGFILRDKHIDIDC
ncbi:hypothetical protein RS030_192798 [Cryptosporidium xiaoi]|uniref:mRNA export factor GLE1 n=1 Tax=Cryptosporidium xiaoi TaxID=659607 RepID=A0AAV9Y459_9CRYT